MTSATVCQQLVDAVFAGGRLHVGKRLEVGFVRERTKLIGGFEQVLSEQGKFFGCVVLIEGDDLRQRARGNGGRRGGQGEGGQGSAG